MYIHLFIRCIFLFNFFALFCIIVVLPILRLPLLKLAFSLTFLLKCLINMISVFLC